LAPPVSYTTNTSFSVYATQVAVGDFSGDGAPDIAAVSQVATYDNESTIILNIGDGTFGPPIGYSFASPYNMIAAADFNGDRRDDLVQPSPYGAAVSVALSAGDSIFSTPTNYEADARPDLVLMTDFDSDGNTDLLVNNLAGAPMLYLSNGDGTFEIERRFDMDLHPLAIVDLTADGRPDLFGALNGVLGVQLNDGGGGFGLTSALAHYNSGSSFHASEVAVADFNGDRAADLALMIYDYPTEPRLVLLLNNGDGTFRDGDEYAETGPITAADFNGDQHVDLAVFDGTNVRILLNSSDATFTVDGAYPAGAGEYVWFSSLTTADFDGNGAIDIAAGYGEGVGVPAWVLLNNVDGTFRSAGTLSLGGNLATADFNGDGRIDLASPHAFVLNLGGGRFGPPIGHATYRYARSVAAADFNGDQKPDLAWANFRNNDISVILNIAPPPRLVPPLRSPQVRLPLRPLGTQTFVRIVDVIVGASSEQVVLS
jgi:hypothetical protein